MRTSWPALLLFLPLLRGQQAAAEPVGEILQAPIEQRFVAERAGLEGVAVQLATYARTNDCRLVLELAEADGRVVARREVAAATLVDLHFCALPLAAPVAGRDFVLRLSSPDARSGNAVTAFCDPAAAGGGLTIGGAPRPGRLLLQMRHAGDHGAIGELVAGRRVVQTFVAPADGLEAVRVLLTDYARTNAGYLDAVLRDPLDGRELARSRTAGAAIGNEHWLELRPEPVGDAGGRTFALELSSPDAVPGTAVTALLEHSASYRGALAIDGEMQLGRLALVVDCAGGGLSAAALLRTLCWGLTGLGAGLALRARRARPGARSPVPMRLAVLGLTALGVVEGYLRDLWPIFYGGGLGVGLALAAVGLAQARWRRMLCVQGGLAAMLLTIVLGAIELFGATPLAAADRAPVAADSAARDELAAAPWSFAQSGRDPERFGRWWRRLTGEWHQKDRGCGPLVEPDPLGELPFLVRAHATSRFFESTIATNGLALRGPEVARDKGDAFRVLCVGESTTMGQTLFASDVPWPERLQALIAAQRRGRRVEVLNAGFAGYDLRHSILRLRRFLLDLQPDLVVVYHGYNGFWMLLPDLPPAIAAGDRVPTPRHRPSALLAAAEFALAQRAFARAQFGRAPAGDVDVERCVAAANYRELVALCRAHGAKVALCSFAMAVTRSAPPEVVAFYRQGFPQVGRQVMANELQTALLRRLCVDGSATFVDAAQDLDGHYDDSFVDLVHFTQRGRDQLAANVLAGIAELLPR